MSAIVEWSASQGGTLRVNGGKFLFANATQQAQAEKLINAYVADEKWLAEALEQVAAKRAEMVPMAIENAKQVERMLKP